MDFGPRHKTSRFWKQLGRWTLFGPKEDTCRPCVFQTIKWWDFFTKKPTVKTKHPLPKGNPIGIQTTWPPIIVDINLVVSPDIYKGIAETVSEQCLDSEWFWGRKVTTAWSTTMLQGGPIPSYKWTYNDPYNWPYPYSWPYKWVTGVYNPTLLGSLSSFITGRVHLEIPNPTCWSSSTAFLNKLKASCQSLPQLELRPIQHLLGELDIPMHIYIQILYMHMMQLSNNASNWLFNDSWLIDTWIFSIQQCPT